MMMAPTTADRMTRAGVPAAPSSHGRKTNEVTSGDVSTTVKTGGVPAAAAPGTKVNVVRAAGGAAPGLTTGGICTVDTCAAREGRTATRMDDRDLPKGVEREPSHSHKRDEQRKATRHHGRRGRNKRYRGTDTHITGRIGKVSIIYDRQLHGMHPTTLSAADRALVRAALMHAPLHAGCDRRHHI